MKPGLAASTALHAALIGWGLFSFSPPPMEAAQVEAMPVEIIPFEELSQTMIGAEDAPLAETPAPTPTEKPETLPMPAQNVGENEVDLDSPPTPEPSPREVRQTALAEDTAPPPPTPEPEPEPEPAPSEPEPAPPVPEPEAAPPEPAQEAPPPDTALQTDAIEQVISEARQEPAPFPIPEDVPVPSAKPEPPEPEVAEVPEPEPEPQPKPEPQPAAVETQVPEEPEEEVEIAEKPEESEFDADEIAALLNRERSAGGGAQRSQEVAALGTQNQTAAALTQSELDALRSQISRCWSPPAGVAEAGSLLISIEMSLDPAGQLDAAPRLVEGAGGSMIERIAGEAALRAVRRCAPYNLPIEKYDSWSRVIVNFDPSRMF